MKRHFKGDVICTLLIVTILCLLLYMQKDLMARWKLQTLPQELAKIRNLLVAQTSSYRAQMQKPAFASKPLCNLDTMEPENVQPSGTPSFNFHHYLRNIHCRDFSLLLNQPTKCNPAPFLLIAVKSLANEFEKREVVRKTWGAKGLSKGVQITTIFLLGVPRNQSVLPGWKQLLQYESDAYRDVLLWDFQDTFFNLTLKEIHFLKWVHTFCPGVQFIFKGDADVYVNTDNILELLKEQKANQDLFIGDIIYQAQPIRSKKSKYFIPEIVYGQGIYPTYAGGGGFLMSGFTAERLYTACQQVDLFPIDDVYLGMCLMRIGLKPTAHEGFRTFGIVRPSAAPHLQVYDPCFYKELMVVHSLTVPEIWLMWNMLHDPKIVCNRRVLVNKPFRWTERKQSLGGKAGHLN
ncbi:B3GN9 acetylglucosaminyltransferase, partial [Polypterus senegalus]